MAQHWGRRQLLGGTLIGGAALLLRPAGAFAATCQATPPNIEGPYYREGAPFRADLAKGIRDGTPLELSGRVTGPDCASGIDGALLDVWQADAHGEYDEDGAQFLLRGKLRADAKGRFR